MLLNGPMTEIHDGDVTIVVFGPDMKQLDEINVADIGNKLVDVAGRIAQPKLILDLSLTEFFGSSFIEALFRVWRKLNDRPDAKFGIACLQPYCREVLEITHLDRLWPLFESREEAIKAFQTSAS